MVTYSVFRDENVDISGSPLFCLPQYLRCVHMVVYKLYLNLKIVFPRIKKKTLGRNLDKNLRMGGFPGGTVVENLPANAGDTGSSPGPGRSHMPWSN